MKRVRVKYTKGEEVKYISHRDLMRVFQRAIRRAEIPMIYSQGFNPHMKISWGQALKVGQASVSEHAELQVEGHVKPREVMDKLNREFPPGIEILDAFLV